MSETIMRAGLDGSGYAEGARVITKANLDIEQSINRTNLAMGGFHRGSVTGFGAAKTALNELQTPFQRTKEIMEQVESRIIRIGATVAVFRILGAAVQLVTGFFIEGIKAVSDYQTQIVAISASLTQIAVFNNKDKDKPLVSMYAESSRYAGILANKMREVDINSMANYQQIMEMLQVYISTNKVLDVNNKLQMEGFTALANAIPMLTTGQSVAKQMATEMRSFATAEPVRGATIARMVDTMAKAQGLAGGLRDIKKAADAAGISILEMTAKMGYFKGFTAALPDIQKLFETARTSLQTAIFNIQKSAFTLIITDLTAIMQSAIKALNTNSNEIAETMKNVWGKVRDTFFDVKTSIDGTGKSIREITLKPEIIENFKALGDVLRQIIDTLGLATSFIIKHIDLIIILGKAYFAHKVLVSATNVILKASEMIKSTSIASTKTQAMVDYELVAAEKALLSAEGARITATLTGIEAQQLKNKTMIENNILVIAAAKAEAQLTSYRLAANASLVGGLTTKLGGADAKLIKTEGNVGAQRAIRIAAIKDQEILNSLLAQQIGLQTKATAAQQAYAAALLKSQVPGAIVAAERYNTALLAVGKTTGFVTTETLINGRALYYNAVANDVCKGSHLANVVINRAHSEALVINSAMIAANTQLTGLAAVKMWAMSAATTAATLATKAFNGVIALCGGPIGAAIVAIGSLIWALKSLYDLQDKRKKSFEDIANLGEMEKNIKAEKIVIEEYKKGLLEKERSVMTSEGVIQSKIEEFDSKREQRLKDFMAKQEEYNKAVKTPSAYWRDTETGLTKVNVLYAELNRLAKDASPEARNAAIKRFAAEEKLASLNKAPIDMSTPTGSGAGGGALAAYRGYRDAVNALIDAQNKASIAKIKDQAKLEEDALNAGYAQHLMSEREYIDKKYDIQNKANNAELAEIKGRLAKADKDIADAQGKLGTSAGKNDLAIQRGNIKLQSDLVKMQKERVNIVKELDGFEAQQALNSQKRTEEQLVASQKLLQSQQDLNIEMLKSVGTVSSLDTASKAELETFKEKMKWAKLEADVMGARNEAEANAAWKAINDYVIIIKQKEKVNELSTESNKLAKEQLVLQSEVDLMIAKGLIYSAQMISDQMTLNTLKLELNKKLLLAPKDRKAILNNTAEKLDRETTTKNLNDQYNYYNQIKGFAKEAYELKIKLIADEAKKILDATHDEVAAAKYLKDETAKAFIAMARASDNYADGVKAAYKQMELDQITWGEFAYQMTDTTFKSMSDSLSNVFMDAWNGDLKKATDYFKSFADSIMKTFFDMIVKMVEKSLMSDIFGGGGGGGLLGGIFGFVGSLFGQGSGGSGLYGYEEHTGGIYGVDTLPLRMINEMSLQDAPRYHSGFAPDEYPAILQKGEGVFTAGQMKAMGMAMNNSTTNNNSGNSLQISVPITVEGNKRLASELRREVEKTVIEVIRKQS